MRLTLNRQFGGKFMTCSKLTIRPNDSDEVLFECDVNEKKYAYYNDKFPKCSEFCLPFGQYQLKLGATEYSGMTLKTTHCPGHNGYAIGYDVTRQTKTGAMLVGIRDDQKCEDIDDWYDSYLLRPKDTFEKLNALVYQRALLEENTITIINDNIIEEIYES